ncbi:MAG TPA: acetyl-CoA carboxylase biotin carboxyl carrier protein [Pyrinomonadaceae bacterium]|jgi:acetyl-CoA carboxylase biotin carboxyl carrier protein
MTTSDQNQSKPVGEGSGGGPAAGAATAPQADADRGARHGGRPRRGRGGRHEQGRAPQPPQATRRADSGLDMEELRELTELFTAHGLTDFEFENADIRIRLSRNPAPAAGPQAGAAHALPPQAPLGAMQAAAGSGAHAAQPAAQGAPAPEAAQPAAEPEEELYVITAPIVGTFYRAPSPTAESFVKVGSQVEPDSVVCIIEAMKLMNEIQAETTGTVAKIYVENGQPVEYGQPLFGVKK